MCDVFWYGEGKCWFCGRSASVYPQRTLSILTLGGLTVGPDPRVLAAAELLSFEEG